MNGPIFSITPEGRRDEAIHRQIINAINFNKSKAMSDTVKRGESLGLTLDQIKQLTGS